MNKLSVAGKVVFASLVKMSFALEYREMAETRPAEFAVQQGIFCLSYLFFRCEGCADSITRVATAIRSINTSISSRATVE